MALVQAQIPESEYDMLRRRARAEGKPIKTVVREALRAHLLPDKVNPDDSVFRMFPLVNKKGRRRRDSRDHDDLLYPARP
jgi:hypothetical protein